MAYSKLPEWPIIDPEAPPVNYVKVGEHIDRDRMDMKWQFFVVDQHLIIVSKGWSKLNDDDPGKFIAIQYEYPIAGARWLMKTLDRFFLHPDHPDAVPRDAITIEEEVAGEVLGVTRGASYGDIVEGIPGYSFDNLNRFYHSTVRVSTNQCQMFEMGDPWLFDYGLLDLFKEIAERHERGEF
jgi:hypothetical protein